ncbi:MAG TPA: aminotransferase class III-fold pyridoxal phosphate-dependent enzyme [Acidimicrobiales bacterium]|nr:aminotransferase class III-fold pyridoxal phosphate-dependent enzyme [Acidimicrobiales bacterium]
MSHDDNLLARHRRVMPKWLSLFYEEPIELVSGDGRTVVDAEGRQYLDFFGGILTTMTGHAVPEVVEATRVQAGRLLHSSTLYLIRPMIELAERIAGLSGIPDAKVFFVNSGSEANDTALMLCCAARRSNQVLAVRHSYHGRSFATMAATGIRNWSASSLTPVNVSYVHGGYRLRSPFRHLDDAEYIDACVADLRDVIETTTAGDVACLIAEPIQGVAGFAIPPDGLFSAFAKVLDEYGILYIADEVQTGWGRTGEHFWGYQAHEVVPDLLTFAKGIGNGLAIGGVVGRGDLIDSVTANSISTFGGNPLASAGALANLEYLLSHDLQANASARGRQLLDRLAPAAAHPNVGELRGRGLMVALEMVRPGTVDPDAAAANELLEGTRRRGLLIGRGGLGGNVLRIAPPLSVTSAETDRAADIILETLSGLPGD